MRGVAQQDSRPRSLLGVMKPGAGFDKRLFDPLFKFAGGQGGEFGELDCKLGHTVQIEPGLRPQSPKNGSFPNVRRRLSAISPWECLKWELGDRQLSCKSPPLAGLSCDIRDILSGSRTAWLGREDSNLRMVESKSAASMSDRVCSAAITELRSRGIRYRAGISYCLDIVTP